ncbi:hypothetical protein L3X38_034185 [Prunus dulcis]|uniref:Uncharacterized protein n=1 Tax=Prunus dulcis TaxID=3755 RepID=A0AAD4VJJ6_PRUDU|nr:hypothetical protein L3X38_034185 [Prunus dulcis]
MAMEPPSSPQHFPTDPSPVDDLCWPETAKERRELTETSRPPISLLRPPFPSTQVWILNLSSCSSCLLGRIRWIGSVAIGFLNLKFQPIFGLYFWPLPVTFWGRSKNKSGSKYGVLPRVGVWSRGLKFFRRAEIALDTHRCRLVLGRVDEGGAVALCLVAILMLSRARRISRISIWIPFEPRTDFSYCAISGFNITEPLDRAQFWICCFR